MSEMEVYYTPIVDYQILSDECIKGLEKAVRDAILDGWQPFGSLVVTTYRFGTTWFYQSMVRYADD